MGAAAPGRGSRRGALLLVGAAALLPPLATRALLLVERGAELAAGDLRGLAADAAAAALVLALLVAVGHGLRWLAVLLAVLWSGVHFANYETVRFLDAMADAADAAFVLDPTFAAGSAAGISRPIVALGVTLVCAAAALRGAPRAAPAAAAGSAALGAVVLAALVGIPSSPGIAAWRQTNVAVWNASRALRSEPLRTAPADGRAALVEVAPELAADLRGEPRVALRGRRVNVLLVVLESLSGANLASLAADHGHPVSAPAPRLDALARAHLAYSSFVAHQRKTNRGLYSLLCGDLPGLAGGEPHMSRYPEIGGPACLPRILRDAGYLTAYHQAAPLAFMLKDRFMPRAGFARMHGDEWFRSYYARNAWGVDDRAFFEQSLALVEELDASASPWFLTLLNVGTHHPFVTPARFRTELKDPFTRAVAYLDTAFGDFYAALERDGLLDDTLVVLTSDESFGRAGFFADPVDKVLSQGWGFLVVRTPEGDGPRRVTSLHGQLDVALSILDYLGLGGRGRHLLGRSVFREYAAPRPLYLGNVNLHAAARLEQDGRGLVCFEDGRGCRAFAAPGGRIFGPRREPRRTDAAAVSHLRRVAARSSAPAARPGEGPREISLVAARSVEIVAPGTHVVFGGQYVDLGPETWTEVELEIDVLGAGGVLQLSHFLKPNREPALVDWVHAVPAGGTLRLAYSFRPPEPVAGVSSQLFARILDGDAFTLRPRVARLRIHRAGDRPPPGLVIRRRAVVAGPAAAPEG